MDEVLVAALEPSPVVAKSESTMCPDCIGTRAGAGRGYWRHVGRRRVPDVKATASESGDGDKAARPLMLRRANVDGGAILRNAQEVRKAA